jgi:thioredoxin reductase (NADPH)
LGLKGPIVARDVRDPVRQVAIVPRDGLGQAVPVAAFAQLIGAPVEEMTEVVPGEVIAEIGQLSGRPDLSVIDARAVNDVEAIVVPPEALRALLVAEAELGERILRALILRRVALIELGFGGPVLVGTLKSPDATRLSHFLERTRCCHCGGRLSVRSIFGLARINPWMKLTSAK